MMLILIVTINNRPETSKSKPSIYTMKFPPGSKTEMLPGE